jgi:hypothetical protein
MVRIGDKVCNVRRPDKIGTVVSLDAPNNKWMTRPEDMRVLVEYKQLTKTSRGTWKKGTIDELPIDLLPYGEVVPVAHIERGEGSVINRMTAYDRRRRLK